jgi:hypothetical protein
MAMAVGAFSVQAVREMVGEGSVVQRSSFSIRRAG